MTVKPNAVRRDNVFYSQSERTVSASKSHDHDISIGITSTCVLSLLHQLSDTKLLVDLLYIG